MREFPGLILLPEPRCPSEVAEALVHEGAHQRFFDLALTRRVLGDGSPTRFTPPWAPAGRAPWPFEQCVAAFHAYCCLAFAGALGGHPAPHTGSLLPVAAHRASVLGEWLHGHGEQLGPDGQSLIGRLTGREFALPPAPTDAPDALADMRAAPHRIATQECGDWTLVMQWSRPATVLWTQTAPHAVGS